MDKKTEKKLVKKANSIKKIIEASVIRVDTIVVADWVLRKCQYGCPMYGRCLTCPPHSPPPEKTAELLKSYTVGLLLHSNDYRGIREAAVNLEREAFLSGLPRAFSMSAGPCHLCKECAMEEGCRHPEKARPSLEACGVDVYSTVRANGFEINVLTSEDQTPDYYSIVLLD